MPKNGIILVRVTREQYERVKNNAHAKGHKTISSYIRSVALEHDLIYERKFNEMYVKVVGSQQ